MNLNKEREMKHALFAVLMSVAVGAMSARAEIVVRSMDWNYDSGTGDAVNTITGFTVDPRSGGKLVLAASWENASSAIGATWNGTEAFTVAVNSAAGRNSAIMYLDDPTPGTGDIVVTFGGNTGSRVGVVNLTGAADGVAVTSFDPSAPANSGSLTTTVGGTFVAGVYTINAGTINSSPFSGTIYPIGSSSSSSGSAGYQTEATAGLKNYAWTETGATGDSHALAGFVPGIPYPEISVINADSKTVIDTGSPGPANLEANPTTLSFEAGTTADKIIVSVSSETGGSGPPVITYNGEALTLAAGTANDRHKGIFYLDNPYNGGAADLTVDMTSFNVVNGVGFGVVSISGSVDGLAATASTSANSVTITPTDPGSFVMVGYGAQGSSGTGAADPPLTAVYGGEIGSAEGAAGYIRDVTAAPQTYSFSEGNDPRGSGAVAVSPYITQGTLFTLR